ncbi:MAG: hypothetical protein ACM31C_08180 [Acidobacteriota bacterium]
MPPGGTGKADGYTTLKGSDIPSAFVDPNKYYMMSRNIANLNTVSALDMVEAPLAKRIDGIIANMPADGLINLAELVRMENPAIHSSLFPQEQAALPKLWKLFEAPSTNDVVYGPKDNFGVLDDSYPPAAAVPPASLAISALPTDLQAPAQRLENVYNSDSDATTVTLADLASGIANPAAFTQAEVTAFASIQAVFRDQAVAQSDAKLVVSPAPGTFAVDATLGPATFHMAGTTTIDEQRQDYSNYLTSTLTATQAVATTVALAAGTQLVVIDQDAGTETVFGAGTVPSLPKGQFVFEAWNGGQRTFSTNATLPLMTSKQQSQLSDKLDYTLMSGLTPLVRNLNSATVTYNGYTYYTVHYTFDTTTIAPPANANQQAVTATSSPAVKIPVGRYSFPTSRTTFYVYPNNVVWLNYGGTMYRMLPTGNNGAAPHVLAASNLSAQFDATTNYLYCNSCQPAVSVTLTSSMRDI